MCWKPNVKEKWSAVLNEDWELILGFKNREVNDMGKMIL